MPLLRKIDKAVISEPVVLFKMVIIQYLYGIPSLRRTIEEIDMNVAYHWFLGYTMSDKLLYFTTISYNFLHRFTVLVMGVFAHFFSCIFLCQYGII